MLGKFLFSCLSFLVLLHRTWFLLLRVEDKISQCSGGSIILCFYTQSLLFRNSCHKGVKEAHILCATSKKAAFKPISGTHKIVFNLSQCPFLGQLQQQSSETPEVTLSQPVELSLTSQGFYNKRVCVCLECLKFSMPLGKITLHPCEKANGETEKFSRLTFRK